MTWQISAVVEGVVTGWEEWWSHGPNHFIWFAMHSGIWVCVWDSHLTSISRVMNSQVVTIINMDEEPIQQRHPQLWRGDILVVQGVWAADQVAALALAGHSPRCGANSPACVLSPHLVNQLWDSWVIDCLRSVVIEAAVGDQGPTFRSFSSPKVSVMLKLSPVLLELVGRVDCLGVPGDHKRWVDDTRFCVARENATSMVTLGRTGIVGAGEKCGSREMPLFPHKNLVEEYFVNQEWCLQWINYGKPTGFSLVVRRLPRGDEREMVEIQVYYQPVIVPLPASKYFGESFEFSKEIPSRAVMIVDAGDKPGTMLVVFDVAKTHATRSLQVVSTTHCAALTPEWLDGFPLCRLALMQNRAGEIVFLVQSSSLSSPSFVHAVQANGDTTQLYSGIGSSPLRQVSGSLFSIYHKGTQVLDVWDCSDTSPSATSKPLRSINLVKNCSFISGGGFIFIVATPDCKQLQVVDGASGNTTATIEFLASGWCIESLSQTTSFLW
ncbi:hypothetical protein Pelo_18781 [Pelomyxa schiedti]|nr:hypothetical protein Pelo_18781 [Pelomyxa schiedti]